jgi:hypothetical protein
MEDDAPRFWRAFGQHSSIDRLASEVRAMREGFQFQIDGRAAGPVRQSWEGAAQDAISAGFAARAPDHHLNSAITWSGSGGVIVRSGLDTQTAKV